jgi:hypothetical protein
MTEISRLEECSALDYKHGMVAGYYDTQLRLWPAPYDTSTSDSRPIEDNENAERRLVHERDSWWIHHFVGDMSCKVFVAAFV